MPTITAIKQSKRDANYFSIYVDGTYRLKLRHASVIDHDVRLGRSLTQVELDDLKTVSDFDRLLESALRMIAIRPQSRAELSLKLRRKLTHADRTYLSGVVGKVIDYLEAHQQLDDLAFARFWADQRFRQQRSYRHIYAELRQKGISASIIEQVLNDLFSSSQEDSEYEHALALLQKKQVQYQKYELRIRRQKMASFLQRKGFSWETTRKAIAAVS